MTIYVIVQNLGPYDGYDLPEAVFPRLDIAQQWVERKREERERYKPDYEIVEMTLDE